MSIKVDPAEFFQDTRRALLWSLATGLIGALFAGWLLQRYEQEVSGGERVLILRAQQPIERGTLLRDELLVESSVPASYVEARAIHASDRAKLRGVRVASDLETQDALLWSDLAVSQQHRDLSAMVQAGNRAVTIRAALGVDDAVGGELVRPGDYVDVLATLTPPPESYESRSTHLVSVLLLQRILVLAVGPITDPQMLRAEGVSDLLAARDSARLTLSLKPEEVQLLSLAQERGKLSAALRQPDDTRIVEAAPELPVSSLFDSGFRNDLQRKRGSDKRPVRLTSSGVPR
jgi:pilus assembly protein CpaB